MKSPVLLLAVTTALSADTLIWDNGSTLNGNPDSSFLSAKNWAPDVVPTGTHEVRILSHNDAANPVNLPSTAFVSSIECVVPFDLDDTLTVTNSGRFENSLLSASLGRLRVNGSMTLQGVNSLSGINIDGTGTVRNEGVAAIGNRGINATFHNKGVSTLLGASTELSAFSNLTDGILDLGERGQIDSSSVVVSGGVIRKENNSQESIIRGDLTIVAGSLDVKNGSSLRIDGNVQDYQGGVITVDGTLLLSQFAAGTTSRVFDGLSSISGPGTVNQVKSYEVKKDLNFNLPNAPGWQLGDLEIGDSNGISGDVAFSNQGHLAISSTETVTGLNSDLEAGIGVDSSIFKNAGGGRVEQSGTSNPILNVNVVNNGSWKVSSMRILNFYNDGTVILSGRNETIAPVSGNPTGYFKNFTTVSFDQTISKNSCTISASYDQSPLGGTTIEQGTLNLTGGSGQLEGTFTVDSTDQLNLRAGDFDVEGTQVGESGLTYGSLDFAGPGTVTIGDTFLEPDVGGAVDITNKLGLFVDQNSNQAGGLKFISGRLFGDLTNKGRVEWQGGTFRAVVRNDRLIVVPPGSRPKELKNTLFNNTSGSIEQSAAFNIHYWGRIVNYGIHTLKAGAGLSGIGKYENATKLVCEPGTVADISCYFSNGKDNSYNGAFGTNGEVQVVGNSSLFFERARNFSSGTLTGGRWKTDTAAGILFPEILTKLDGAVWEGPGTESVTCVTDSRGLLKKTTSSTHAAPLVVEKGATVDLGAGTTTTVPKVEVKSSAVMKGVGALVGDLELDDHGVVAPGDSPGTLSINGKVTFGINSTYEWEASSASEGDLLAISTPVALAGTITPILLDDFLPEVGQSFTILTAPSVTGSFDHIDLSRLPPGLKVTPTYNAGSVTLTFANITLGTYEAWKQTRFTPAEQLDPTISGPNVDPDRDGLANLMEFAYGLDPRSYSFCPLVVVATTPTSIDLRFPWVSGTEAIYEVLTSADLTGFVPTAASLQSATADITPGVDELTVRCMHSNNGTQYARLQIVLPVRP